MSLRAKLRSCPTEHSLYLRHSEPHARIGFPRRALTIRRSSAPVNCLGSDCRFALERVAPSMSCYRVRFKNQEEEIMAKPEENDATRNLSPAQEALSKLWEEHVRYEFSTRNTDDTLATMVDDAYVNHVPVLTGGVGKNELREFYSKRFIPQMPPDTEMTPVSRTIGEDQLV